MDEITCARCERTYTPQAWRRACPHCGMDQPESTGPYTSVPRGVPGQWTSGASPAPPTSPPASPWSQSPYSPPGYGTPSPVGNVVPERRKGRAKWPLVMLICAVLVGASAGATVFMLNRGSDYPSKWDPRVAQLADFVERERGLEFKHPVYVDFLSDAEFRKQVTARDELTDEDKAQIEREEAMLRAMGLVSGDVDLLGIADELVGDGTVGFYRFEDERIAVRGDTLDNEARATLVHELTHVLQDQHFDLGDMEPENSGAEMALTAVAEADADDVQAAWVETLSQADRDALEEAEQATSDEADFEGVPSVFIELMGFPYAFGPSLLETVEKERGKVGRDDLFINPPTSEEHIVLPSTYLEHQSVTKVVTPEVGAGEKAIEDSEGDFGMVSLLVVLAERIDYTTAWQAVQGWAGDSTIAVEKGGKTCVRVNVTFDAANQAGRFEDAFAQWGQGFATTHSRSDRLVSVESCDPGKDAAAGRPEGHVSGIQGLGLRMGTSIGLQTIGGLPRPRADCMADSVIEQIGATHYLELDQVLQSGSASQRAVQEIQAATRQAAEVCP